MREKLYDVHVTVIIYKIQHPDWLGEGHAPVTENTDVIHQLAS